MRAQSMPEAPKLQLHLLLHIASLLEKEIQRELATSKVSHDQARYLDALRFAGPLSVSELARGMHTSQPASTTMVTRLETLGLVERAPDAYDARAQRITLTARGRRAAISAAQAWQRVENALVLATPKLGAASLHQTLLAIRDKLGGRSPNLPRTRERTRASETRPRPA
jgi:DNA-binding MarR family transcriptional regulator